MCLDNPFGASTGGLFSGGKGICEDGGAHDQAFGSVIKPWAANDVLYYDPLGQNKAGKFSYSNGAPEQRTAIFNRMNAARPTITKASNMATAKAFEAAADPSYGAAKTLANRTIAGDYLNGSPQVENQIDQMRSAASREVADSQAGVRDQFARNGMQFSTANQQAQDAARVAATANANNTEAGIRAQNYQTERGRQYDALDTVDQANNAPLTYLSQVPGAQLSPLTSMSQIVSGMGSGGQIANQNWDNVERDGVIRDITKTIGAL